jgi:DNA polymerase III subunit epsilon
MNNGILSKQLCETPLVVFDLETTGFSPRAGDEIVEIGAVKTLGGEIVETFHTMVNPIRPIHPGASAVNGITNDMVAAAPLIKHVLPGLLDFIGDSPLVAHNAAFDLSFLAWKIAELGLPRKQNVVFDTMLLSRRLRPHFFNHKLATIVSLLGIETAVGHRAVSDAVCTLEAFKKLLEPHSCNGGLTIGRALSYQAGSVFWPYPYPQEVAPGSGAEV